MVANKSDDDKPVEWHKSKWTWVMVIVPVLIFGLWILLYFNPIDFSGLSPHSLTAPAKPSVSCEAVKPSVSCEAVKPREPDVIRVEVDPEKWSEWIHIPPNSRFEIDRPRTWLEFEFLIDGSRKRIDDDKWQSLGKISDRTFRLRGTKGPVEIFIEPR